MDESDWCCEKEMKMNREQREADERTKRVGDEERGGLRIMVNTGTKQRSQSTTVLEESAGKRRREQKQKEECWGTNQNQYGVCASGTTPYRNLKSIIIGRQEPRKSENGN